MFEYKLKKGTVSVIKSKDTGVFFMLLDCLDLPIDEVIENYGIVVPETLVDKLKALGY